MTEQFKTFSEKVLRLKIVQQSKKDMPGFLSANQLGTELDADLLSTSGVSMTASEVSGTSGLSETSKKSVKRAKKGKKKLRKKRAVKEGSPFEEDYLLGLLKEIKVTDQDKLEVDNLMKGLLHFNMLKEASILHDLLEKLIKAEFECFNLLSVEQGQLLESNVEFEEQFGEVIKKKKEVLNDAISEWSDKKFFKHT